MSRRLNVGSGLLFIVGIINALPGLLWGFGGELYLGEWMTLMNEELLPSTVSQIRDFSPNLLNFMTFTTQLYGLYALSTGLLVCVISLIPYRRGEKWAWYAMLVIGGIFVLGHTIFIYTSMTFHFPFDIILVIL